MTRNNSGSDVASISFPLRSAGGIYRRKHTLRALFRSSILVLLLGGYALYHRSGGGNTISKIPATRLNLRSSVDSHQEESVNFSRLLKDAEGGEDDKQEPCPVLEVADPKWLLAFYSLGSLYMFIALAIVCDEFFVPALEEISSENHLNLSMDVAGATLMAAGGSAPELFTSFVGTFKQSDIGIGTIVGSAVFNVLFVIGMCSILSKEVLTLTWWPLFRDSAYYAVGLIVLSLLAGVFSQGKVLWWEALILLGMYVGYVLLMYYNRKLYTMLTGKVLVLAGEESDACTLPLGLDDGALDANRGPRSTPLLDDDRGADSSNDRNPSQLAPKTTLTSSPHKTTDFRRPTTFRAGILKLLLHPESWKEKAGIGIVAMIEGDVDRVFEQVDLNKDGIIDKEELGSLFEKLGHHIGEEELGDVFKSLNLDATGGISKDEFSHWYMTSEEQVLSKVRPIFEKVDADKSGTIGRTEIRELLKTLEPRVTESDVDDAIEGMHINDCPKEITYSEFSEWYCQYIAQARREIIHEEENGVCEALSPPRGEGFFAWLTYFIVFPLVAVLTLTIPDVRRTGYGKWCYASFVLSIGWIGIFSYFMVDWVEILGNTLGIPSVVMGYTVLAAGTSVPDLFSSVIVARMGEGDMAVSSSIGSNIFDILVGLPLPWLVFTIWPSTPDVVLIQATGIWQSIAILVGMLVAIIAIVHCQGWKMTRTVGGLMFVLYFAFLVQAILTEYFKNPCFG